MWAMIEKLRIFEMSMGKIEPICGGWGRGDTPLDLVNVANIKSQKKRILTNAKSAERNKAVRSEIKTRTRNALTSAGTPEADATLNLAVQRIDSAAAKGIIHRNAAARRKSRLMKRLNAAK